MTFRDAIIWGEEELRTANIEEAKNDAWLLLSSICKIDQTFYYLHLQEEVSPEPYSDYQIAIQKRKERIPLQYILGEQEFMGLSFRVNEHVLIPRQDTETLVEEALQLLRPGMRIMDMCTGSGCILTSLLYHSKEVEGCGYDISKQAVFLARENAKANGVVARFEKSDLFENVKGTFDMIISNPPYIPSDVIPDLMPEVSVYEPIIALDGKEDGLYFYRKIVAESGPFLEEDGILIFEIGHDQAKAVTDMMKEAGFSDIVVIKDLANNDRVVKGRYRKR